MFYKGDKNKNVVFALLRELLSKVFGIAA